ncbi:endolytic transglycosylase MltG [Dokdonella sp.]|uniref:endolytic transglycosylase MltG n=1 Tax=Dokdonella sp. TaxID=2291710 RepID=UPI0026375F2D|nr:endolytic transglycosylase MltG [Dokdonella sp.]
MPANQRGGALLRVLAFLVLAGVVALAIASWRDYRRFTDSPMPGARADATIDVARGARYRDIVRQIRRERISRAAPFYWRLLGREMDIAGKVHAGEYSLPPGLTPRELLRKMAAGDVVQHRFTIVDGWTFRQLRVALASESGLVQTLPGLSDEDIARKVGIDDGKPEGWFLPETYSWIKGESDFDVLARSHAAMKKALDKAWAARDAAGVRIGTPYEALILASIVEKETGRGEERPMISGVFMRRLKFGMRLQTDPTVIYGMGASYDGNIRKRDLETDTPWNTYTRDGLPPTPIALPGLPALEAATHPAPGDALYFVARGDGSHEFTSTLDEHNRAVRKYQLRRSP